MVALDGNLVIDAPGGGSLRCTGAEDGDFHVICSDAATARAAFRTLRAVYPPARRFRFLAGLRNPLAQEIDIKIGERFVLRWPAGKLPRVTSLRGLLSLLRG